MRQISMVVKIKKFTVPECSTLNGHSSTLNYRKAVISRPGPHGSGSNFFKIYLLIGFKGPTFSSLRDIEVSAIFLIEKSKNIFGLSPSFRP